MKPFKSTTVVQGQLALKEMTISTRRKPRKTEAAEETVVENNKNDVVAVRNKKSKTEQPAILQARVQDSVVRTVLDRLDGKSVILHGIDRTRT